MKSALTDTTPIQPVELETSTGWVVTAVALIGAGIAAPGAGVCAILYVVGLGSQAGQ